MRKSIFITIFFVCFPLSAWGQGFGWTTGDEGKSFSPCDFSGEKLMKLYKILPEYVEICKERKKQLDASNSKGLKTSIPSTTNSTGGLLLPIDLFNQNARDLMGVE